MPFRETAQAQIDQAVMRTEAISSELSVTLARLRAVLHQIDTLSDKENGHS